MTLDIGQLEIGQLDVSQVDVAQLDLTTGVGGGAPTAPDAPSGLGVAVTGKTTATISWTDNSDNEDNFSVERRLTAGPGAWSEINAPAADATSYNATGLTADVSYDWRVRAQNAVGDSVYTSIVAGVQFPADPSGLIITITSETTATVDWTDNSSTETSFRIERRTGAGAWSEVGNVGAGVVTFADTGMAAGIQYGWRVRARSASGDSDYTAEVTDTTFALTQSTAGLLYESDFSSDDRADFTFTGSSTVTTSITDGRLRLSPPDNNSIMAIVTGITAGKCFAQISQYYPSGVAESYSSIYLRSAGTGNGLIQQTDGYSVFHITSAQNTRLNKYLASAESTLDGPDAGTTVAVTDYVSQLFVDDSIQEGWFGHGTPVVLSGTDAAHDGQTRAIGFWMMRFVAGEPHGDFDNVVFMKDDTLVCTGLGAASGRKLKIFDSGDSEIFSATESGGTATINASRFDSSGVNVPVGGWAYATITDSGDTEIARFTPGVGGVYPGDVYAFAA